MDTNLRPDLFKRLPVEILLMIWAEAVRDARPDRLVVTLKPHVEEVKTVSLETIKKAEFLDLATPENAPLVQQKVGFRLVGDDSADLVKKYKPFMDLMATCCMARAILTHFYPVALKFQRKIVRLEDDDDKRTTYRTGVLHVKAMEDHVYLKDITDLLRYDIFLLQPGPLNLLPGIRDLSVGIDNLALAHVPMHRWIRQDDHPWDIEKSHAHAALSCLKALIGHCPDVEAVYFRTEHPFRGESFGDDNHDDHDARWDLCFDEIVSPLPYGRLRGEPWCFRNTWVVSLPVFESSLNALALAFAFQTHPTTLLTELRYSFDDDINPRDLRLRASRLHLGFAGVHRGVGRFIYQILCPLNLRGQYHMEELRRFCAWQI